MKKLLIASAAVLALGVGSVHAQDNGDSQRVLGATAAGTTGAIAGAVVGGPIGAIVGGFAGAVLGAEAAVPDVAVQYVVNNPVEPVYYEGEIVEGALIPETIQVYEIPEAPEYGYVYLDNRPVTYVEANPIDPVTIDAEIVTGAVLPSEVEVIELPDYPSYGYIYTENGPVLVERGSRTVIWVE
jgi:hypothetical protein